MTLLKLTGALLIVAIGASAWSASAASTTTPNTNAAFVQQSVTADDMKPVACAGIVLTSVIGGSGTLTGSAANELITGSSAADTIDGLGGDDCIVGGDGDDDLTGGADTDVCLGGAGTDAFTGCETETQ
jgi:Ca2+-binding RTX toxin-like protein